MATTTTPPRPGPKLNPATLKFTAVKVDVSALTTRCRCKAFVISSKTTAQDLADMVLKKLKIDVSRHPDGTCLVGDSPAGTGRIVLSADDQVLSLYGTRHKKTLMLELVPVSSVEQNHNHQSCADSNIQHDGLRKDSIKAGNLDANRNGMTLPGYKKVDANCNLAIGSGFVTSTPNPDCNDSLASTTDSGFMIHYEPYNGEHAKRTPMRSRSFELARDQGCKLDTSSGNASDSGMVVNGNGHCPVEKWREKNSIDGYSYRPSPQDGFQILQSKNSAWTPFSRHASDGYIKSLSQNNLHLTCSVPNVNNVKPISEKWLQSTLSRRRSLPKMSVSQEQLEEKKRSVTDLFALKLREYIQKSPKSGQFTNEIKANLNYNRIPRENSLNREDDTMSVTSEEVAEIMRSASPMKPYEEEESSDSEDETPDQDSPLDIHRTTKTPQNAFHPLTDDVPDHPSDQTSTNQKQEKKSLSEYVDQSIQNFLDHPVPENIHKDQSVDLRYCDHKVEGTSNGASSTSSDEPPSSRRVQHTPSKPPLERGVPLFALLTTHLLAPVMVRRNREMAPHKYIGVRLCDVTYAKCVRHVIRHWASNSRHFSIDPNHAERLLVAVGGIERLTTITLAGKLFRGDIIVEINGKSALTLSAREVMSVMTGAEVVSLVVARSRLNVERAQTP